VAVRGTYESQTTQTTSQQVIFIKLGRAMHEKPGRKWDPITTRSVVRRVEHEPHDQNNCCDLLNFNYAVICHGMNAGKMSSTFSMIAEWGVFVAEC